MFWNIQLALLMTAKTPSELEQNRLLENTGHLPAGATDTHVSCHHGAPRKADTCCVGFSHPPGSPLDEEPSMPVTLELESKSFLKPQTP